MSGKSVKNDSPIEHPSQLKKQTISLFSLPTTLPPPKKDNVSSLHTSKKLSSGVQAPNTHGAIWKITIQSQKSFLQRNTLTKNISPISKRSKGLDNTKEKKSNTLQHVTVGPTSTIRQSISTERVHRRYPIAQATTTQPASKKYWKEWIRSLAQPSRNSKQSVDPPVQPYKPAHTPSQLKQVRFLLHPCPRKNNPPQYHLEPELPRSIPRHKPAPPRDPYCKNLADDQWWLMRVNYIGRGHKLGARRLHQVT